VTLSVILVLHGSALAQSGTATVGGAAQPVPSTPTPVLGEEYTVLLRLTNTSSSLVPGNEGRAIAVDVLSQSPGFPPPEASIVLATNLTGTELPGTVTFLPQAGNGGCVSKAACVTSCAADPLNSNRVLIGVSNCTLGASATLDLATIRVRQDLTPSIFLMQGRATYRGSTGTCGGFLCSNSPGHTCTSALNCDFSSLPGLGAGTSALLPTRPTTTTVVTTTTSSTTTTSTTTTTTSTTRTTTTTTTSTTTTTVPEQCDCGEVINAPCVVRVSGLAQTFTKVQQAIDAAPNGAAPDNPTIVRVEGRCDGPVLINNRTNLTLEGVPPAGGVCPTPNLGPSDLTSTVQGIAAGSTQTEVVRITKSTNIVVRFLNIVDGPSLGVYLKTVTPVSVHCNCIARHGDHGVELNGGGPNEVTNNISRENGSDGIRLDNGVVESKVLANCVEFNDDDGIELEDSPTERHLLAGNVIRQNQRDGIDLDDSDENMLLNNQITNNGTSHSTDCGVKVQHGADVNVINANDIRNNADGLVDLICCLQGTDNTGDNVTPECR
jgi:parallel beta-helix repeat protein